jgi:hypothetical protein
MIFVSDCVPENATKTDDGLYWRPEEEKMAKCIKMFDGIFENRIVRVPDSYAAELVHIDKRAEYVPKADWKKEGERKPIKKGRV